MPENRKKLISTNPVVLFPMMAIFFASYALFYRYFLVKKWNG